jgi:hypothetical protein
MDNCGSDEDEKVLVGCLEDQMKGNCGEEMTIVTNCGDDRRAEKCGDATEQELRSCGVIRKTNTFIELVDSKALVTRQLQHMKLNAK